MYCELTFATSAFSRYFPSNTMLFSIIFATIFLTINHFHSTLASPIVSNGGLAAGQSLNLTNSLAKRVYKPPGQLCTKPGDWFSRKCLSHVDDSSWIDTCDGR